MIKKLCSLVDRFEKVANFPDVPTITNIIARILKNNSSNALLKGAQTVPQYVNVNTSIDNNSRVSFQILFEEKYYGTAQANAQAINNWLAPLIVKELSTMFRQYEFSVRINIVPA